MRLAELCSQAVGCAKNGNSVNTHNLLLLLLSKELIKFNPDGHRAEVTGAREPNYYMSDRALGTYFGTSSWGT